MKTLREVEMARNDLLRVFAGSEAFRLRLDRESYGRVSGSIPTPTHAGVLASRKLSLIVGPGVLVS